MWTTLRLTPCGFGRIYVAGMGTVRESGLLSAAGHLSNAADELRALGLVTLAEEIDSFIAMLDVEILLGTLHND
jgi:hypothetical protein